MPRRYWFPALALSFLSTILLVLITISTPTTLSDSTPFDFVRSSRLDGIIDSSPGSNPKRLLGSAKFGTWGYCSTASNSSSYACFKHSHGFSASFSPNPTTTDTAAVGSISISSSWTRGLAVHVVAFVFALLGLILTAVPKQVLRLAAMVVNSLAALMALTAFAIDIALFVYVQRQMRRVAEGAKTMPGPGFYMSLVAIFLASAAAAMTGLNWRSESWRGQKVGEDYRPERLRMEPTSVGSERTEVEAMSASQKAVLGAYEESKGGY